MRAGGGSWGGRGAAAVAAVIVFYIGVIVWNLFQFSAT